MNIVEFIVNILLLVASILLVVIVLMQDSKNAGLGSAFGSDTTSFGNSRSKKASREKQLQKITVILGVAVAVLAIIMLLIPAFTKWFTPSATTTTMVSIIETIV